VLKTQLKHVQTKEEATKLIHENRFVIICCGRMGPMCVPVYNIMSKLEKEYPHVVFTDMDFDIPDAEFIQTLPECSSFMGLPFTVYFRDGSVVKATSSIQTREQMVSILDTVFKPE